MAASAKFDPDQVAHFEAVGWRAYYDRNYLKLLSLIVNLCQVQFRIPFPNSLLAAYYVTRAAAAWAPVDHDKSKAQRYYEKFYRLAQRYSGLTYDPALVGALELEYNEVHRQLSGQPDKTAFVDTMIKLHSALFDLTPDEARESAELRVKANNTVDLITSGKSTDPEADWITLEKYLCGCYRSIEKAVMAKNV